MSALYRVVQFLVEGGEGEDRGCRRRWFCHVYFAGSSSLVPLVPFDECT